jgi:hypothetical protein
MLLISKNLKKAYNINKNIPNNKFMSISSTVMRINGPVLGQQIPALIVTPSGITELLVEGKRLITSCPYISNVEDIKKMLKIVEDLYDILSTSPNLKNSHLIYVEILIGKIYSKIIQLPEDDIKRKLSTKLENNQECIKILIKLIEFSLKNLIDVDIVKFNILVVSIIKKYYIKDANANLKKLFDISIRYNRFDYAEFYLKNMTYEAFDSTCLASSICLSEQLNKHRYYYRAKKILKIAKHAIDYYLKPAEYSGEIEILDSEIKKNISLGTKNPLQFSSAIRV